MKLSSLHEEEFLSGNFYLCQYSMKSEKLFRMLLIKATFFYFLSCVDYYMIKGKKNILKINWNKKIIKSKLYIKKML